MAFGKTLTISSDQEEDNCGLLGRSSGTERKNGSKRNGMSWNSKGNYEKVGRIRSNLDCSSLVRINRRSNCENRCDIDKEQYAGTSSTFDAMSGTSSRQEQRSPVTITRGDSSHDSQSRIGDTFRSREMAFDRVCQYAITAVLSLCQKVTSPPLLNGEV
jgi:hypothetical protein